MQNLGLAAFIRILRENLKEKNQVNWFKIGTIRAYKESIEDKYTITDLKIFVGDYIDLEIITSIDK